MAWGPKVNWRSNPSSRPVDRNPGGMSEFFRNIQNRSMQRQAAQNLMTGGAPVESPLTFMDMTDINNIRQETANAIAAYQQQVGVANADADYDRRELGQQIGSTERARQLAIPATQAVYDDEQNQLRGVFANALQGYQNGAANVGNAYSQAVAAQQDDPQAQLLQQQLQGIMGDGGNLADDINSNNTAYRALLASAGQQGQGSLQQLGMGNNSGDLSSLPGYAAERDQNLADYNLSADAAIRQLQNQQAVVHPEFIPFNLADLQTREAEGIQGVMRRAFQEQQQKQDDAHGFKNLEGARQYAESIGRPDLYNWFSQKLVEAGAAGQDPNAIYGAIDELARQNDQGSMTDEEINRKIDEYRNSGGFSMGGLEGGGGLFGVHFSMPHYNHPSQQAVDNYTRQLIRESRVNGTHRADDSDSLVRLLNIYLGNYSNNAS